MFKNVKTVISNEKKATIKCRKMSKIVKSIPKFITRQCTGLTLDLVKQCINCYIDFRKSTGL